MRHRKRTFKLGRTGSHRSAMLANMACSLITEGRIKTTLPKAKGLRRFAEKLITQSKLGTLHARRLVASKMRQPEAVQYLFDELAPVFEDRAGGYTRIIKLGRRLGDGAEMCYIELVDTPKATVEAEVAETEETTEA